MNTEELQIQIANLQKERGMSNVVCEGVEADLLKARSESTDSSAKKKLDLAKWPFTKQPLSKNDKVSEMPLSYTSRQVLQRNNRGTQFCWFLLFFPSGIWLSTELVVLEVVCLILSPLHGASCLMWIAERSLNSNLQQRWSQSAGRNIDVQDFMKFVSGLIFVGPWAAEDVLSPFYFIKSVSLTTDEFCSWLSWWRLHILHALFLMHSPIENLIWKWNSNP